MRALVQVPCWVGGPQNGTPALICWPCQMKPRFLNGVLTHAGAVVEVEHVTAACQTMRKLRADSKQTFSKRAAFRVVAMSSPLHAAGRCVRDFGCGSETQSNVT